ncbi:DEAD/DEAH box helicase family protein [uncultured Brachyspira sp.]|uniref:DEAD/DEAH box helicase family protein n=1 Tax=uncultured Brachyspira sp. TaxID=221953 RepID=UPI0027DC87BD|nr:DEAD/DEAH box helicase family protein [uncultured Brachyspira sp.]
MYKKQQKTSKPTAEQKELILNKIISKKYNEFDNFLKGLDFKTFSHNITLQEYQQAAIKNALISLKLYMNNAEDLYFEYMQYKKENPALKIERNEINRSSFWMATGSGKTIVMIKLISILSELILKNKIPKKSIMLLAPNDKILTQFKSQIQNFNNFNEISITVRELKDFEKRDFEGNIFNDCLLYIARSDLIETEENVGKDNKAKRINYKNFLQKEGWYILLDEAHKGDSKDSVRKSYFNTLARGFKRDNIEFSNNDFSNGFIFNFSATFDSEIDLITCAFNYNLERFNNDGYGKNIAVLDSDSPEKIERIIESFIIFTAIKLSKNTLLEKYKSENKKENLLYHNPLIIAVSDKVNTEDAGVKLYFEAILKILKQDLNIKNIVLNLIDKLKNEELYFSNSKLRNEFLKIIEKIDSKTVRESVFYANEISGIEACKIKGNDKELAFKSKNASKPFLLLNIGNIREWEKEYITKLKIGIGEDLTKGYFDSINDANSPINIMMGSKVFTEGWDSNRVNLISFINIGSRNAKKYVLQTIGRGVRIEPFANFRQRIDKSELEYNKKEYLKQFSDGLETLFIMATDSDAIQEILKGIESFRTSNAIKGFKINKSFEPLLVPKYKESDNINKIYKMSEIDFKNANEYIESFDKDVLLLSEEIESEDLGYSAIQKILNKKDIEIIGDKENLQPQNAIRTINNFFNSYGKDLREFKNLTDEICHFEKISSDLDLIIIDEINKKIKEIVKNSNMKSEKELMSDLKLNKITLEEYTEAIKSNATNIKKQEVYGYELNAELSKHYYNPIIIDKKGQGNIIYAIRHKSEIDFLEDLQTYLLKTNNELKNYKWHFCRLVENVDNIFIPYFDEKSQEIRNFYPDFIFWIKKDEDFIILFIDPKGLEIGINNAQNKLQGFKNIFENKNLEYQGQKVKVKFIYYNKETNINKSIKEYTKSSCENIFNSMIEN